MVHSSCSFLHEWTHPFSDEREMSDHGEMDARFDIRFTKLKSNYNKMHYDQSVRSKYIEEITPYKHIIIFIGHMQRVQIRIRRHMMRRRSGSALVAYSMFY